EIVAGARAGIGAQSAQGVLAEHGGVVEPELVEVAVDRATGVAVTLDEGGAGGSSAERLETHRARAGEEIEHRCVLGVAGWDQRERRLAHAIARRPRVEAVRREDARALS